jgi:hypothetical protein
MALTKEAFKALVALQLKDNVLDAIQKEIDAVPPRIAALQADLEGEKRHMPRSSTWPPRTRRRASIPRSSTI